MVTKKISDNDLIPKTDRELTLRIMIEEIHTRYRNYLVLGFFGIVVLALSAIYAFDSYRGSKSVRNKYYKEIEQLINLAYQADPKAHAEVVRRFPILLRGRLAESIEQVVAEPQLSASSASVAMPQIENGFQGSSAPVEPAPILDLYADRSRKSALLGTINDAKEIASQRRSGEWSAIELSSGVSVWIYGAYVAEESPSSLRVTASRVGLRHKPQQAKEFIVGIVDTDATLEVVSKHEGWYEVRTPEKFEVWTKADDLQKFLAYFEERSANEAGVASTALEQLDFYTERSEGSIRVGSLTEKSAIRFIKQTGDWSSISLSKGVPVWIDDATAKTWGTSLVKVTASEVSLQLRPEKSLESVVGTVRAGDTLELITKFGGWFRVYTPQDYSFWVKTEALERFLKKA